MTPRRVIVPTFELVSNPKVSLSALKSRRSLIPTQCPVCAALVPDLIEHARSMSDPEHCVLEVTLL